MRGHRLTLPALLLASFVVSLDTTIVNIALPTLARELAASTSQLQWIVGAYSLVFAALLLTSGSLSDRLGRKGMLLAGLAVFGAASAAGGLTSSPGQLIAARATMGVGAAMIFPATLSLISNIYVERKQRARAIGLWGAATGAAVALGPIVGGWLLELFSWPAIFFAMAPVAAVAAALVARAVPTSRDPHAREPDPLGLVLSSAAIALLTYTIIEAPDHGWATDRTIVGFAVATSLFVAFVAWQRRAPAPLLDLDLFRNLRFTAASASVTVAYFSLAGFLFLVTQYFQFFKGYGPLETGVRMLPVAVSVAVFSVLGAKLALRYGTKLVVTAGLVCLAVFFGWASTDGPGTVYAILAVQGALSGAGMALTSTPATEAIMGVVPKAKAGIGSAVNDATRILGSTLGVAVIGSIAASLYVSRLETSLPAALSASDALAVQSSVGPALEVAQRAEPGVAAAIQAAASSAFFDGMSAGFLVAAGVCLAGSVMAAALLPAHPGRVAEVAGRPAAAAVE